MKKTVDMEDSKLGSRPVLAKVMLGSGLIGLIVSLETHPAVDVEVRRDEVFELMSDALEVYDFVETGILPSLIEEISLTPLAVDESHPKEYSFHSAIPLRRAAERGNYLAWNNQYHNWDLRPFSSKTLSVNGHNIMLIVKEKTSGKKLMVA